MEKWFFQRAEDESQHMFHILAGISYPMATSLSIKISWCTFIQQHKHYTKEALQSRVITLRLPYFLYWFISTWTAIIQQWTLVNNNFSHKQAVCGKWIQCYQPILFVQQCGSNHFCKCSCYSNITIARITSYCTYTLTWNPVWLASFLCLFCDDLILFIILCMLQSCFIWLSSWCNIACRILDPNTHHASWLNNAIHFEYIPTTFYHNYVSQELLWHTDFNGHIKIIISIIYAKVRLHMFGK